MSGRTTWWACDAAEHDRELVVELGEEHGPAGPYLLRVLKDLAQQQRHDGGVKTGFRSLARKTFCSPDGAREIVDHASRIGALDDLTVDDDGRRFTCRVSGWLADQTRGSEAIRKAQQRRELSQDDGTCPEDPGPCPAETDAVPHTRPDLTKEEETTLSSEAAKATTDTIRLCRILADLIVERDAKAKPNPESAGWLRPMRLLLSDREGDAAEVERVLRWSQADSFWQTNILSPLKLRKQFTALTIKMKAAPIREAVDPRAAPTRWQERSRQWAIEDGDPLPGEEQVA